MKAVLGITMGCFLCLNLSVVEAAWWGKKEKAEAVVEPVEEAPAQKTEVQENREQKEETIREARRALVENKRRELNDTEWGIELFLMGGATVKGDKPKKETDVIIFRNNQVSASGFAKRGFAPVNYTLTVQDDGTVVWETMQKSENEVIFWRGEIQPDMQKMYGALNCRIAGGEAVRDYSFSSTSRRDILEAEKP